MGPDRLGEEPLDLGSQRFSDGERSCDQHLDVLQQAGLLRCRREGRSKLHWFDGRPLEAIRERWPLLPDEDPEP